MCQGGVFVSVFVLLLLLCGRSLSQAIYGDGRDGPFNPLVAKSVTCGESNFHVHLEFKFPFHGVVRSEDGQCRYIDGLSAPRTNYNFTVPLEQCGTTRTVNSDTNHVEFRNKLQIQRQRDVVDMWTLSYTLYCLQQFVKVQPRDAASSDSTDPMSSTDRLQVLGPESEVVRSSFTLDGQMKVRFESNIVLGEGPGGQPVNRAVQLGERLTYVFRCNNEAIPGTDCAVGACSARGSSTNVSVELSDANGCSMHPSFWSDFVLSDPAKSAAYERVYYSTNWAWSLHSDTNVVISCKLRLCPSFCERSLCDNGTAVPRTSRNPSLTTSFETDTAMMLIAKSVNATSSDSKTHAAQLAQGGFSHTEGTAVQVSRTVLAVAVSLMMLTIAVMALVIVLLLWKIQKPH